MNTLVLEIKHKDLPYKGYYLPSTDNFKARYRSLKTRDNAFKKLIKTIKNSDFIESYIIKEYEGVYDWYKNNESIAEYAECDLYDMELL